MIITDLEAGLDRTLTERIISKSVEVFPDNGTLFRQGERPSGIYLVMSGEVMLSMRAGEAQVRVQASKGSLLGLPAVIGNRPYSMTAKAASNAEVFKLSSKAFNELLSREPGMQQAVLQILAEEVHAARNALTNLASAFVIPVVKTLRSPSHQRLNGDCNAGSRSRFRDSGKSPAPSPAASSPPAPSPSQ